MLWIRSAFFFVFFILGIVGYAAAIVVASPVASLAFRRGLAAAWGRYNLRMLALFCGLRHEIIGAENLPAPPYLIMSKHQSAWETVVFYGLFPSLVWALKKELAHIPFFGWALQATQQIFIDRAHPTEAMKQLLVRSQEEFKRGSSLVVFPEGTRMAPGKVGDYKAGGIGVAVAAGVPIVAVAHNAGLFWGRREFVKRPGVIRVRIAPPIATHQLGRRERQALLERVKESIEGMMAEIGCPGEADLPPAGGPEES
ncbi:MAG: 1-acyl-sn-glycerol-3-phosphate acyltransferase [Magnetococcales bacterium]|nr:1-acyl-sn-glycerol-3-phosphate acyltransferase [Magnetococcales bacterium]